MNSTHIRLRLQQVDAVNINGIAIAVNRDGQRQCHRGLSGGYRYDKRHERLAGDGVLAGAKAGEGEEREVDGIQHEFDAHEHANGVALAQGDEEADAKEDRPDDEKVIDSPAHASASSASSCGVRASIIAPTRAAVSSTEATSNGRTQVVSNASPRSAAESPGPPPVASGHAVS